MSDDYVSVEELRFQLSAVQPPTVIDVRGSDEYADLIHSQRDPRGRS